MKQTNKRVLLAVAVVVAALMGTVFMLFPVLQRQREQKMQKALLVRLEQESVAETDRPESLVLENTDRFLAASMELSEMISGKNKIGNRENTTFFVQDETTDSVTTADIEIIQKSKTAEIAAEPMPEAGSEIGILTIPKIGARLPVTAGVTEEQLKISEGWVMQTAPIGSVGNAVVAGHRSYTWGRHFNRLDELEAGDEIIYTKQGGETMRFVVYETLTVKPDDPAVFAPPPAGRAQLTLYTCTPVRIATHRLVVRALLEE